jgi:hypothetical protein
MSSESGVETKAKRGLASELLWRFVINQSTITTTNGAVRVHRVWMGIENRVILGIGAV